MKYLYLKEIVFLLISIFCLNECNERPFYCKLLLSQINGRFDGIQVYSHRYTDNNGNLGLTLRMFKTYSDIEWDFDIDFDENGRAVDIKFYESSVNKIDSKALNIFTLSFKDSITTKKYINYKCILKYKV